MAALPLMRRAGSSLVESKVWCRAGARRALSAFDDKGSVLRDEERSREAVFIRKREAELLEKLRKQGEKLEEIKRALTDYKESHSSVESWVSSKLGASNQVSKEL